MTEAQRISMLERPAGKISMILDTDTYNEVDDQFAVAYAVRAAQAGELVLEALRKYAVSQEALILEIDCGERQDSIPDFNSLIYAVVTRE